MTRQAEPGSRFGAWDERMTQLLRDAAEVRESRDRARTEEDERLARRETAALLDAIRAHARLDARTPESSPRARRTPGPTQVMP